MMRCVTTKPSREHDFGTGTLCHYVYLKLGVLKNKVGLLSGVGAGFQSPPKTTVERQTRKERDQEVEQEMWRTN